MNEIQGVLPTVVAGDIEAGLGCSDVSKLTPEQRLSYYMAICKSMGVSPLTKPFILMRNQNGEQFFYPTKECAEQMRRIHCVSFGSQTREIIDDILVVTVFASLPNGRRESSIGAVDLGGLKGKARADAFMRAESKAKRRATLALIGLGFTDSDDVYGEQVAFNHSTGEIIEGAANITPPLPQKSSLAAKEEDEIGPLQEAITAILEGEDLTQEAIDSSWKRWKKKYPVMGAKELRTILAQLQDRAAAKHAAPAAVDDDIPY